MYRFEEGDRVIRTYPDGTVKKGIVVIFVLGVLHHMVKSLEDEDIHWNIDGNITRDTQYYREERLKQLLGGI